MMVPDVNVLLYAYDSSSHLHSRAKAWWEGALSGGGAVGIPWVVVLAFTRLMTHPTLSSNPMTTEEVRERINEWFAQPQTLLLVPRAGTLDHMFDLLGALGVGGNLSTDALIAAHALEHGGVVCSNDHDFGRFQGVRWINPLDAESN